VKPCCSILLTLLLLAGCAGQSTPFVAQPVKNPDNARVYVYWPAQGWREKADEEAEIQVDGVPVGLLRYKTYLSLEVPAGNHEFRLTGEADSAAWKADWDGADQTFEYRLKPGGILFVRLLAKFDQSKNTLTNPGMSYVVQFLPRSANVARMEMASLKPSPHVPN